VSKLIKSTDAYKKLQLNDTIIQINNQDFSMINHSDWCAFNSSKLSDTLSLKIKRKDSIKEVELFRQLLIN